MGRDSLRRYSDRTRSSDFKLKEGKFRLVMIKKFFSVREVRYQKRLFIPRSVKGQIEWGIEQPHPKEKKKIPVHISLEGDNSYSPFQPKPFFDSA